MEIIELTAENIDQYIDGCIEVQKFLIKPDETIDESQFRATAAADHSYFIAVIENGNVAGLGVVNKIIHPVRTNGYIDNIVVHEDHRGKGLFSIIMDALENKAKEWGAEQAKLTCSRVPVQPLYEKRGYTKKNTTYYVKAL